MFPVLNFNSIPANVSAAYVVVSPLYKEIILPLEPWTFNAFSKFQEEVPIITLPSELMLSLCSPAVSNVIKSSEGNLIFVLSPVWIISFAKFKLLATNKSPTPVSFNLSWIVPDWVILIPNIVPLLPAVESPKTKCWL